MGQNEPWSKPPWCFCFHFLCRFFKARLPNQGVFRYPLGCCYHSCSHAHTHLNDKHETWQLFETTNMISLCFVLFFKVNMISLKLLFLFLWIFRSTMINKFLLWSSVLLKRPRKIYLFIPNRRSKENRLNWAKPLNIIISIIHLCS